MSASTNGSYAASRALARHAFAHLQGGRLADAERTAETAVRLDGANPLALSALGAIRRGQGRFDEAIEYHQRAIALDRNDASFHFNLGNAQLAAGRVHLAIESYSGASALAPGNARFAAQLGFALITDGQLERGVTACQRAISIDGNLHGVLNNLGIALKRLGKYEEAVQCFEKALAITPNAIAPLCNLADTVRRQKQYDKALAILQEALALGPDAAGVHSGIGTVLTQLNRCEEALIHHKRAVQAHPQNADIANAYGYSLMQAGELDAAQVQFRQALRMRPNHWDAHLNSAMVYLLNGDFENGWREYEYRLRMTEFYPANERLSGRRWNGEPLQGKTIVLNSEQGFGDTIHFVRYASLLAAAGARVVVACQAELARVLGSVPGVSEIIECGKPLPSYDYHCPLPSVPFVLGTRLETIPGNVPYITPEPRVTDYWRRRLKTSDALKVGLCWAGKPSHMLDRYRSLQLTDLAPVLRTPNVEFVSLQKASPGRSNPECAQ